MKIPNPLATLAAAETHFACSLDCSNGRALGNIEQLEYEGLCRKMVHSTEI
jgi:hypothetical protein